MSPRRGAADEFATLLPTEGDPVLRVQRTIDGSTGVHVDFHVDDVGAAAGRAVSLGATLLAESGHAMLRSPAGLVFCFVADAGERRVPPPVGSPPAALDQIAVDVPDRDFAGEIDFWSELLGWARRPASSHEFQRLEQPDGLPFRLLFQRLGRDSPARAAGAHLDISAGEGREDVAARHVELGASHVATFDHWIVLEDPAGLPYCVTYQPVAAP